MQVLDCRVRRSYRPELSKTIVYADKTNRTLVEHGKAGLRLGWSNSGNDFFESPAGETFFIFFRIDAKYLKY